VGLPCYFNDLVLLLAFHQFHHPDPALDDDPVSDYISAYNHTSRSRITGLNEEGVAFINATNPQDEPGAGYAGSAMIALDTRGVTGLQLNWEGGTVLPNVRSYGIRVQYRTGQHSPFRDLRDAAGMPIEYIRHDEAGHRMQFDNIPLPAYLEDKPYVNLRFKYYYVDANRYYDPPSGPRAKLALHNIAVTSTQAPDEPPGINPVVYPNPGAGRFYIRLDQAADGIAEIYIFDFTGRQVDRQRAPQRAGFAGPVGRQKNISELPLASIGFPSII
jgi:hypothetical protein